MTTSSNERFEPGESAALPGEAMSGAPSRGIPAGLSSPLGSLAAPDLRALVARIVVEGVIATVGAALARGPVAMVVPLCVALAVSTWVAVAGETVWFGVDWVASAGLLPPLVVTAGEVVSVTGPGDEVDLGDLVVRTSADRAVRIRADRLGADAGAAWAFARFLTAVQAAGADVSPSAWVFVAGVDRW